MIGQKTYITGPLPSGNILVLTDCVWHLADKGVEHVVQDDMEYDAYWVIPDEIYSKDEFSSLLNSTLESQKSINQEQDELIAELIEGM